MADIQDILQRARAKRATDVHVVAGAPVLFRIEGELLPVTKEPLTSPAAKALTYGLLDPAQIAVFEQNLDFDFVISDAERCRYRVNVSFNDGEVGAVIRLLPSAPLPLAQLRLPECVSRMTQARKGLILEETSLP